MMELFKLCAGYGKEQVLYEASLKCEKGKISTLIGPNGCGKSTLLKTVIGMLPIKEGEIRIDGVSISELSEQMRAQKIAYLAQSKNVPDITVEKMVLHGRFPYLSYPRRYRKCDYEAAYAALEKMGIVDLADKALAVLSGGMRQKVYIAMALCQGAEVILLDEPATYLDISQQFKVDEISKELAAEGKTVLSVSHNIIAALKSSDAVAVMDKGKILAVGSPDEILKSGVIPRVFGVEVLSFESEGEREFYYRRRSEGE